MKPTSALDYFVYLNKRIFKGYALFLSAPDLAAITFIQPLLTTQKITAFTLKNNDMLLFFNNNKAPVMMDFMFQLKRDFPQMKQTRFDLKKQWNDAFQTARDIQIFPTQKTALSILNNLPKTPLTPTVLGDILSTLTPEKLNTALPVKKNCVVLNLTSLRQKLFPQIDLNSNPILTELLYQQLTRRLIPQPDIFIPTCVTDLSDTTPDKIILRLSDIIRHYDTYKTYRANHTQTVIQIEPDIPTAHLNLTPFKDTFMTFE